MEKLRRAASLPPSVIAHKVARRVTSAISTPLARRRDHLICAYANAHDYPMARLRTGAFTIPARALGPAARWIVGVTEHYLQHQFDLLGSGWVKVAYGVRARGVHGVRYEPGPPVDADAAGCWLLHRLPRATALESARIWRLIDGSYEPIDWQLDWKSGYRWSERTWYRDIQYRGLAGADVKVPWELARMQHLAHLAYAFILRRNGVPGGRAADTYRREFRNQVIDFIATNPPRFGVNWSCTMDVAIRAANWLVAFDLFRNAGAEFDPAFESLLARSVGEHASFIARNFEWSPELRGNHYLANIVGLLFCAAYLPRSARTDAWLALGVQELIDCVATQFYPDGGNFEASTCYHRLSAEMVAYGTALVLGLPPERQEALAHYDARQTPSEPRLRPAPIPMHKRADGTHTPFPDWYGERLQKMAEFTAHLHNVSAHVPQFGDNDSGRFLKLQPVYHERSVAAAIARYQNLDGYADLSSHAIYWDEDHLDHRHLVAAINALFGRSDLARVAGAEWWEAMIVRSLAAGRCLLSYRNDGSPCAAELIRVGALCDLEQSIDAIESLPPNRRRRVVFDAPGSESLRADLRLYGYPAFGLYVFKSARVFLAVRCGPVGQNGNGGHDHGDQLAIELAIDGIDIVNDPGTYLYTPVPELRNAYRSARVHAGPWFGGDEPARFDAGPFVLVDGPTGTCAYFGEHGFAGRANGRNCSAYCALQIEDQRLVMLHGIEASARSSAPFAPSPIIRMDSVPYSPGYGQRYRTGADRWPPGTVD